MGTVWAGREIKERKERGKEKRAGGIRRVLSMKLHHWWLWEALWVALCLPMDEHQLIYVLYNPVSRFSYHWQQTNRKT
jgi:hypothetical protein